MQLLGLAALTTIQCPPRRQREEEAERAAKPAPNQDLGGRDHRDQGGFRRLDLVRAPTLEASPHKEAGTQEPMPK